nr:uncharacterized protein LOC113828948 [Penaeus vannamei]
MVDNRSNKSVGTSHSCKSSRSEISVAEEELERLQFIKEQNEHAREEERRIFELQQRIRRMKTSSEPARSRPGSSCGDSREDERHPRPHSFNNMCSNWIATSVEPIIKVEIWTHNCSFCKHQQSTCHTSGHDFTSHPSPSRTLNMDEVAQMSNTNDPRRRLTQLYNQLDGPPKDLIEGCLHLPPDHGYDEAWRMLREEYENSSELLESFISKLFAWKDIEVGDAEGLKKYGSYLFNVEMALGDNICRMELRETISKIVGKLPRYLRTKWASRCVDPGTKSASSFSALVKFVKDQARVAEEIRYIEAGRGKPSHTTNKPIIIRKPVNSLNVHALDMNAMDMTPSTSDKCHCCNGQGHKLFACYKFGRKDVDERWDIVTHNKLCFRCLKPGHGHRFCNDKSQCDRCGAYYHHTLLHRPIAKSFAPSRKYKRSPTGSVEVFSNENIPDCYEKLGTPSSSTGGGIEAKGSPDGRIMMKILPVRVNNSVSTYAFIDGGAAPTLAARSLIQRLGIQGLPVRQAMKTENGIFMCNERVPLMLSSIGGGNNITVNEVYITDKLSITTDSMMPVNWTKKWLHLNDVDLQRLPGDNQEVELIIGLNSILNRHILDQRHGTDDEPSAYLTRFGWVVFGPTGPRNPLTAPVYHISPTQDLGECLREHFNADFWEKEVHSQREDSLEDKLFSDKISQSIHQESGKYVVKLPFRDSSPLPNNREMAVRRMKSLKRKLESDKTFKETYITQMEKNIRLERNDGRIWYMPHHAVRHPTKLKVRVVYDLKAKFNGTSLNDHLLQGPDLTNPLIGVLMRFRHGHYAVTADIEEMFIRSRFP